MAACCGVLIAAAWPAAGYGQTLDDAVASVVSVLPQWPPDARRLEEPEATGVVVLDGRTVVTALHVVAKARAVRIRTSDGHIVEARVAGQDAPTDIAILRLEEALAPMRPSLAEPPLGAPVCAIGNAFGLGLSVSCGVVSGRHVAGVGFNAIEDFVQTDAAVNPGASGGALVTREGAFVGLLSAIFTKKSDANIGVNFAVSAALVEHVVRGLAERGRVERVASGLRLEAAPAKGETGRLAARIVSVVADSAAERAGLKPGDLIVKAGSRRVRAPADFVSVMATASAASPVEVEALRDGAAQTFALKF